MLAVRRVLWRGHIHTNTQTGIYTGQREKGSISRRRGRSNSGSGQRVDPRRSRRRPSCQTFGDGALAEGRFTEGAGRNQTTAGRSKFGKSGCRLFNFEHEVWGRAARWSARKAERLEVPSFWGGDQQIPIFDKWECARIP